MIKADMKFFGIRRTDDTEITEYFSNEKYYKYKKSHRGHYWSNVMTNIVFFNTEQVAKNRIKEWKTNPENAGYSYEVFEIEIYIKD